MNQVRLSSEILKYAILKMEQEGANGTLQPIVITPVDFKEGTHAPLGMLVADLKVLLNASEDALALRDEIEILKQERTEVNDLVVKIGKEIESLKETTLTAPQAENNAIECIEGLLTEIYDGSCKVQ